MELVSEADQPIEPTFDTPEADDYEPVERSDGSIEFEFRESEERYVTWVMAQDEDGRFGVVSLGGYSPATR